LDAIARFWNPDNDTPPDPSDNTSPDGTPPTPTDLDQPFSDLDQPFSEQNPEWVIQKNPSHHAASSVLDQLDHLDQPSEITYRENFGGGNVEAETEVGVGQKSIEGGGTNGDPADPTDPKPESLDLQGMKLDRPLEKMADPNQESEKAADPKSETEPERDPLSQESVAMVTRELTLVDREVLAALRQTYPAKLLNAACKFLPPQQQAQIKQWVVELNEETAALQFVGHNAEDLTEGDVVSHAMHSTSLKNGIIKTLYIDDYGGKKYAAAKVLWPGATKPANSPCKMLKKVVEPEKA
jgi:hypothetical protein